MVFEGYRIFYSVLGLTVYLLVISGPADITQKKSAALLATVSRRETPLPSSAQLIKGHTSFSLNLLLADKKPLLPGQHKMI